MKAWREVATPHNDVLAGTLKQSEFAADLSRVAAGTASPEYQDPVQFFNRTYITEGMKILLVSIVKRLNGEGGDPVIQLQTNFGGGKTHTLLAVYHLATRTVPTGDLRGIGNILAEANVPDLPHAKAVVIDGNNFAPNQPLEAEGLKIRTLWGLLGYRLMGVEGYNRVKASDEAGTAPSKDTMIKMFQDAGPCVILCDELTAFMRQLIEPATELTAGTFENNTSFIQVLTEAAMAVDTAVVLCSLPESNTEVAGGHGITALSVLLKYFGRVEAVWKPVATEESFEIVRRRLFADIGSEQERDETCQAFATMYAANHAKFPVHTQEAAYVERMRKSYPIHPEIFDRLYNDWSTIDRFQRTRGVLQYMAIVINRLWNLNNADPLIMPGSLPLFDHEVEKKSTHYLTQGWDPVVEGEVDGPGSVPGGFDARKPLYGGIQAACRTARTIFFGSAPSSVNIGRQAVRGIDEQHILLGCAIPGHTLGTYETVLGDLRDHCKYLYVNPADQRFWYDTHPNLLQEMRSRKEKVPTAKRDSALHDVVWNICSKSAALNRVYVFTPHEDIGDTVHDGLDFVVMPPDMSIAFSAHSSPAKESAYEAARKVMQNHGGTPRLNTANRMVFLFPEQSAVNRLQDQAKTYLAWKDILDSYNAGALTLDILQFNDAKTKMNGSKSQLLTCARECYKHLLVPETGPDGKTIEFQSFVVTGTPVDSVASLAEELLKGEELLVPNWSPIHLATALENYFNNATEVTLKKLWKDICQYPMFPKLLNEGVLASAAEQGIANGGTFGYADGKVGENYSGFRYGEAVTILTPINDTAVLISHDKSEELHAARKCPTCGNYPCTCVPTPTVCSVCGNSPCTCSNPPPQVCSVCGHSPCTCSQPQPPQPPEVRHFYGTVKIDPHGGAAQFSDVMTEVVNLLTTNPGVNVSIKVDINAESSAPFDRNTVVRHVKENCNTLHFEEAQFE